MKNTKKDYTKSLALTEKTHTRLKNLILRLQVKLGRNVSADEILNIFMESYEEGQQ